MKRMKDRLDESRKAVTLEITKEMASLQTHRLTRQINPSEKQSPVVLWEKHTQIGYPNDPRFLITADG